MIKKLLMFIGLLAILGIGAMLFLGNKIDSKLKEKEPEFRQYITMTTEEQNAYVEKNFNEFFNSIANFDQIDGKGKAAIEKLKADPEALQAGIAMGRSMVAELILANEDILKDLSADIHNKLQAEADEGDSRTENFKKHMEKYFPKKEN